MLLSYKNFIFPKIGTFDLLLYVLHTHIKFTHSNWEIKKACQKKSIIISASCSYEINSGQIENTTVRINYWCLVNFFCCLLTCLLNYWSMVQYDHDIDSFANETSIVRIWFSSSNLYCSYGEDDTWAMTWLMLWRDSYSLSLVTEPELIRDSFPVNHMRKRTQWLFKQVFLEENDMHWMTKPNEKRKSIISLETVSPSYIFIFCLDFFIIRESILISSRISQWQGKPNGQTDFFSKLVTFFYSSVAWVISQIFYQPELSTILNSCKILLSTYRTMK